MVFAAPWLPERQPHSNRVRPDGAHIFDEAIACDASCRMKAVAEMNDIAIVIATARPAKCTIEQIGILPAARKTPDFAVHMQRDGIFERCVVFMKYGLKNDLATGAFKLRDQHASARHKVQSGGRNTRWLRQLRWRQNETDIGPARGRDAYVLPRRVGKV